VLIAGDTALIDVVGHHDYLAGCKCLVVLLRQTKNVEIVQVSEGHWDSNHVDLPKHPITSGVIPWEINDGWLNAIQFVEGMMGVTPLVWSSKGYAGSRAGLDKDIVA